MAFNPNDRYISASAPANANLGDRWFNPSFGANGGYWQYQGEIWIKIGEELTSEDFLYSSGTLWGSKIAFTSVSVNGGVVTSAANADVVNQRGSIAWQRKGRVAVSTAGSGVASRALIYMPLGLDFSPFGNWYMDWDVLPNNAYNSAADNAVVRLGSFSSISTIGSNANPANEIYFRVGYTSEGNTNYKLVVRIAGVDVAIINTGLVHAAPFGFVRIGVNWNGVSDTLTWWITDELQVLSGQIDAFLATYPVLSGSGFTFMIRANRELVAPGQPARSVICDRVRLLMPEPSYFVNRKIR